MKDRKAWKRVLGLAGWLCIIALGILALTPADEMVRTDLGGRGEHVVAYAITALLLGLAYRDRAYGLPLAGSGLVAYGGALELLQHFSPGLYSGCCRLVRKLRRGRNRHGIGLAGGQTGILISRLLPPDIVEAIINGRRPAELGVHVLREGFPKDWGKQRAALVA